MGDGVIAGGWEYVWAAYIITWVSMALFASSLIWRGRGSRQTGSQRGEEG